MSEQQPSTISAKSPEALQKQIDLINIQRETKDESRLFISSRDAETKKELDKKVKNGTYYSDEYATYLKSLREMRKLQGPFIDAKMQQIKTKDPQEYRAAYLDAISSSTFLNADILKKMHRGYRDDTKMFQDEELQEASSSDEVFVDLLKRAVSRYPQITDKIFRYAEEVLPAEKIKEIITVAIEKDPQELLQNVEKMSLYFSHEEMRAKAEKIIDEDIDNGANSTLSLISRSKLSSLFDQNEIKDFVVLAIRKTNYLRPGFYPMRECLKKGILTEDEIHAELLAKIGSDPDTIEYSKQIAEFFPEDKLPELKKTIKDVFLSPNPPTIDKIDEGELNGVFTREEQQEILRIILSNTNRSISADFIAAVLPQNEAQHYFREAIKTRDTSIFGHEKQYKNIIEHQLLPEEELSQLVTIIIEEKPEILLSEPDLILKNIPEADREMTIREALNKLPPSTIFKNVDRWINVIQDPHKQKLLLMSALMKENSFTFIRSYASSTVMKELFTSDEISVFFTKQLELGSGAIFFDIDSIVEYIGDDKKLRTLVDEAAEKDPGNFLIKCEFVQYLYLDQELQEKIETLSKTPKGMQACISEIYGWARLMQPDFVFKILKQAKNDFPEHLMQSLTMLKQYIPREERIDFFHSIIEVNPPVLYRNHSRLHSENFITLSEEDIIAQAQNDSDRISFAPKSLAEFYQDIQQTIDPVRKKSMLKEAVETYQYIQAIKKSGLEAQFRLLQESQAVPKNKEKQLLEIYTCFSELKKRDPEYFSSLELGASIEESQRILLTEFAKAAGFAKDITLEQGDAFFATMENPMPFIFYAMQYEYSAPHKKLLTDMFDGILNRRFKEWKFSAETPEQFMVLKEKKLIPEQLTIEQYILWQKDESLTLRESLSSDAKTVAQEIHDIVSSEREHLGLNDIFADNVSVDVLLGNIQEGLRLAGSNLGEYNKRLSILRRQEGYEQLEEYRDLMQARDAAVAERDRGTMYKSLLRLISIKPEEIVARGLLEGADLKKKGPELSKILSELHAQIPQEGQFVLDRVEGMIDYFASANTEKQDLICEDTSDVQTLMEIGDKPVPSCQHYSHGSHNDCLLGYSDPNTKFLILRNEKGNIIARSVFRILEGSDKIPRLHMEKIYSSAPSEGVMKVMYERAYQKAQEMGLSLAVSDKAQNEEGIETEVYVPAGFSAINAEYSLVSSASRAPKVYVDSAGGVRSWGDYRMNKLLELRKSAAITQNPEIFAQNAGYYAQPTAA